VTNDADSTPHPDPLLGKEREKSGWPRLVSAAALGLAVTFALNAVSGYILRPTNFEGVEDLGAGVGAYFAYYDGCVALFTLAVPAFLGGLALAAVARGAALPVSLAAFGLAAAIGFAHVYWQVPSPSPASIHNRAIHYMETNPLVLLSFGTFGAWLGAQFAVGRFKLDDRNPVHMPGLED
jgi:hypothetical protein